MVWQSRTPELRSEEHVNIDIKEHTEKSIGVFWFSTTDELTFSTKVKDVPASKRTVLSIVITVYDPPGLLACWLKRLWMLLQNQQKLNLDLDDNIPEEFMTRWNRWLADLAEINTVRVKRHMFEKLRPRKLNFTLSPMPATSPMAQSSTTGGLTRAPTNRL